MSTMVGKPTVRHSDLRRWFVAKKKPAVKPVAAVSDELGKALDTLRSTVAEHAEAEIFDAACAGAHYKAALKCAVEGMRSMTVMAECLLRATDL